METLVALGLAANIVQFLDFGSKLISTTKEVAGAGAAVDIVHLSNLSSDLVNINDSIKSILDPVGGHEFDNLSKEEQVRVPCLTY